MSGACAIAADAGVVRSVLWSVDCNARGFAQSGYQALAGGPMFQAGLTTALTIYVALIGWRMLFAPDRARLSEGPRTALKIGAILALVTSWNLFQTLVFDVAAKAPSEIASVVASRTLGPESLADPVGRLQVAYDQVFASAAAFGKAGEPPRATAPPAPGAAPLPPDPQKAEETARAAAAGQALSIASALLLLVHTSMAAASRLAVDILGAAGPLFIALFLFRQTRGVFVGWVRAMTGAAIVTAGSWLLILMMLRALDPWLVALAEQRELNQLDPNAGMAAAGLVEIYAVAQIGMAVGAGVIAFGFSLKSTNRAAASGRAPVEREATRTPSELATRASALADQLRRFDHVFDARSRAAAVSVEAGRAGRGFASPGVSSGRGRADAPDPYRRTLAAGPSSRFGGRA